MDWKKKTTLVCVGIGALVGFIASRMMISDAEANGQQVSLDAKSGAKIAMTLLDAVKKIS